MTLQNLKQYWRVVLLVVLVVSSVALVFGVDEQRPTSESTAENARPASMTTLEFGLELAGGTRIRAPLVGITATEVSLEDGANLRSVERTLASQIDGASPSDVSVQPPTEERRTTAIEVRTANVTQDELSSALSAEGIQYESIRRGVTAETRAETVRVIESKINKAGLSGGNVRSVTSSSGEHFILVEVPQERRTAVKNLISQRGAVQVDMYYPTTENGTTTYKTTSAVLTQGDFRQIGIASNGDRLGPHVPVVLKPEAADRFRNATMTAGIASGGSRCSYESSPNDTGGCLLTTVDGDVVYSAGMSPSLGRSIKSGEWLKDPSFVLQTRNISEAQELALHLRAGALPTRLDMSAGTSTYISPTQGEHFKTSSVIIAFLAIIAVAGKVFLQYRDLRVAVPMVGVALTEIVLLLGVASLLDYPIDLAVVGGFIAVIGTGVDDLIIIANEVLAKGDVNSDRVFQSRYKKAFWVIGAAALTTCIAMSPLVALSLGDLRGFAIFTIIGIFVGVLITRPVYGDLLHYLLLDD